MTGALPIEISFNGEPRLVPATATVDDVIDLVFAPREGCAVARNGTVVLKSEWSTTRVFTGDELEVLTASPGG